MSSTLTVTAQADPTDTDATDTQPLYMRRMFLQHTTEPRRYTREKSSICPNLL